MRNKMLLDEFADIGPLNLKIEEKIKDVKCWICKKPFSNKVQYINGWAVGKAPLCPECKNKIAEEAVKEKYNI